MLTFLNGIGKAHHMRSQNIKPTDFSNLSLWLDATDTSTITQSGGNVSRWDDKSGNGHHLTQPNAIYQPLSQTRTLNGLNVLDFDQQYLQNTQDIAGLFTGTATIFVVSSADDFTDNHVLYISDSPAEDGGADYNGGGAANILEIACLRTFSKAGKIFYQDGTAAVSPMPENSYTFADQINVYQFSPGAALKIINDNGETGTGGTTPAVSTYAATRFRIGAHGTPVSRTDRWFNGAVGEVIIYNRVLSDAEINTLGAYLADKWGLGWTSI